MTGDIHELTPVERHGDVWLKRDDLFQIFGACGGKARAAYALIRQGLDLGFDTFVTAGSRESPQCELVSAICEGLGVNAICVMPRGKETSIIRNIGRNSHTELVRAKLGYNTYIIHMAKKLAQERGAFYIPFGMECWDNIRMTMSQAANIPDNTGRVVVPVGSGMTLAALVNGLHLMGKRIPVLGIQVGKDPRKILDKYLFEACRDNYQIQTAPMDYHTACDGVAIDGIPLDRIYEAKCRPFLQGGDCLWIVGRRQEASNGDD
ncbi:MAG: pyridoxal-phosphate dependent enzyme [Victivallales bacterium]|nr:pyridoxal-phosphate dependent enzyme [Victivallales bacterium]